MCIKTIKNEQLKIKNFWMFFTFILHFTFYIFNCLYCQSFPDAKNMDNEYEMDMFMDYFLPEWNFLYWANPTGLRIASGSMDIKRFYLINYTKDITTEEFIFCEGSSYLTGIII